MAIYYCLGIESTAHTFGAAVVRSDGTILSNEKDTYQTEQGGMIPMDVAKHHERIKEEVVRRALEKAKVTMDDIHLISVAARPGLAPALRVGVRYANKLAKDNGKKLIGINHCVAHLTIGELITGLKDPVFIYVSGVNTQVIALSNGYLRVLGETLDVALGNALDKLGRDMGLGFPAGPRIEELAKKGKYIELTYSVKGMDVSFSGLVTKASRLVKDGTPKEDVCKSVQETAFAMLCEVAERALAHTNKDACVLIGGVAANKRLCEMMQKMCDARKVVFAAAPLQYAGDQGAMIAWQGILEHDAGREDDPEILDINPKERADEVRVTWH